MDLLLQTLLAQVHHPLDQSLLHHRRHHCVLDRALLQDGQTETLGHTAVLLVFHDIDDARDDDHVLGAGQVLHSSESTRHH